MSIRIMTMVWEFSRHKGGDLLTLLAISDHADDHGIAYPSTDRLAQKTRMTRRNVINVIKRLEQSGEVKIFHNSGPNGTHKYEVIIKNLGENTEKITREKISQGVKKFHVKTADRKFHTNHQEQDPDLLPIPSDTPNQSPTANRKPKKEKIHLSSFSGEKDLTPQLLMNLFNEQAPPYIPKVRTLSDSRTKKAKQYLRQFPEQKFWEETMAEYHASAFLCGEKNSSGHEAFRADFDWLLSKGKDGTENCVKVHDGKYRDSTETQCKAQYAGHAGHDIGRYFGEPFCKTCKQTLKG